MYVIYSDMSLQTLCKIERVEYEGAHNQLAEMIILGTQNYINVNRI